MAGHMPERWSTYARAFGTDLEALFSSHFNRSSQKARFILGRGFDPRMLTGLTLLRRVCPTLRVEVVLLTYEEGDQSPSRAYDEAVKKNLEALTQLVPEDSLSSRNISMFSPERRRMTAKSAEGLFKTASEFTGISDIVIDISALPRSVFLPIVAKLLHIIDGQRPPLTNLFLLADENHKIDSVILEEGLDEEADYIHTFRGDAERESAASKPRVWFPLLGENQGMQLQRIYDLVRPSEVCPLLPAPSHNPRRGDNLILEHRGLLFDSLRVDPRNFLYASETNPFEVYRQLVQAIKHYSKSLEPLGGSNAIVSALSSKLLSIGALLAAYELKRTGSRVAIAHIEAHGHRVAVEMEELARLAKDGVIHGLWLAGECYED
jgi:hypothetical protein